MTYFDCCCDGWCVAKHDDFGELVCPCVPHDARECIANCCYLILCLGLIVSTVVVVVFGLLIVHDVSFTVEDASLTTFDLEITPTVAITYNLSMTVRVHNLNWFWGVQYYTPLLADCSFDGSLFAPDVWLADAGGKVLAGKGHVYKFATGGVNENLSLGASGIDEFVKQSSSRVFEVDMVLTSHYTLRGSKRTLAAICPLNLPGCHLGRWPRR